MIPRTKKGVFTENDLMMYLAIGLKHLRLMVLLMCMSLLAGLAFYTWARPIFESVSYVEYDVLKRPMDAQDVFRDSTDRIVRAQLSSAQLVERVARKMGVKNPSAKDVYKRYLKGQPKIKFDSQHNIVIVIGAYSYEWARDFSQLLVSEYLMMRTEERLNRSQLAIQEFSKDMAELRQKMDAIFVEKSDFAQSNELAKIQIEEKAIRYIPRQLEIVKKQIGMMEDTGRILDDNNLDPMAKLSLLSALDKNMRKSELEVGQVVHEKDGQQIVVMPQDLNTAEKQDWETIDRERRGYVDQYNRLSERFMPGHRLMVALKSQIDTCNQKLGLELQVATNKFSLGLASLEAQKKELEGRMPEYQSAVQRLEKGLLEYKHFDDGQLKWQSMYAEMERKLNAFDYADDKDRAKLKYAGFYEPLRDYPTSPHRLKLAIYSLIMGLALAIAIPYLIEYLDSRVNDVEYAEETLQIRGLGVVPKIENEESQLLSDANKTDYHLQENFRVIRTNIAVQAEGGDLPQVILITSAMPQEGKTVVSSNLAMSFATKGEKTLLIDADLRRGRLHRVFGAHNKPGLSDVLREKRPIEDAYRPTTHENLTLMTCGKHLNSASEILDSPAFAKMIQDLRGKYTRIIIDSPPVLGLAETSIIQRYSDGILFVIWSEFTPMRNVKAAIQSLQAAGGKFYGFVLNRLDFHALGNRYKYFYYAPNYYTNYKAIEAPAAEETKK